MKKPVPPPSFEKFIKTKEGQDLLGNALGSSFEPVIDQQYLPWDKLRHLTAPRGMTHREWWFQIKLARTLRYKKLSLLDAERNPFQFALVDPIMEKLHQIDQQSGGQLKTQKPIRQLDTDRFHFTNLVEEAASSSLLEGAATTRKEARKLLRTNREPRDPGERMIVNNYSAMKEIRSLSTQDLSQDLILHLHHTLTSGTLEKKRYEGGFRKSDDITVQDAEGQILHKPPQTVYLEKGLNLLCDFANSKSSSAFIHPILKAILLHYYLAYLHPFVDGNGRVARALFYWYVAKQDYWLLEYTSISTILRKAPAQYARSFLYTASDDNDVTYFLDFQLTTIARGIESLHDYLLRKQANSRNMQALIKKILKTSMNERQTTLLHRAIKDPQFMVTIRDHQTEFGVVYQTARADLLEMVKKGVLESFKAGKKIVFTASKNLPQKLGL
jgi:Fic family protein